MAPPTALFAALLLAACAGPSDTSSEDPDAGCPYPSAAEPMALGEPLAAYSWAQALRADGRTLPLDLARAFCDTDAQFDWSAHDYMLFVSVPAW